jgi:enediyne biosynthesis protein E4
LWPSFGPGSDLSGHDLTPFFARGPDGRYHDIGSLLGLVEPMVSRGIAVADVDGDGRLDFVTANQWGPSYVFRNESPDPGAFLGLRLVRSNGAPAIGAVARVGLPDGRRMIGQVDGGSGHSGRRSPDIHLGLGVTGSATMVPVEVSWRDGGGYVHHRKFSVAPGWRTIELRDAGSGALRP